jgi:23S rRNA (uracil1939-C5)-methyltransferase
LRVSTGKRCSSKARFLARAVTIATLKRKPTLRARARRSHREGEPGPASSRGCPHFGVCGGCSLQHSRRRAQVAAKQRTLEDALWHIGRVRAAQSAASDSRSVLGIPESRTAFGAARRKEGRRARRFPRAQIELRRRHAFVRRSCREDLGSPARAASADRGLSVRDRVPQIELAVGDDAAAAHVLVLRILEPLARSDEEALAPSPIGIACKSICSRRTRDGGAAQPGGAPLAYALPEFDLVFPFARPSSRRSIRRSTGARTRAIALLDPQPGERVADFFAGSATSRCRSRARRDGGRCRRQRGARARAEEIAALNWLASARAFVR